MPRPARLNLSGIALRTARNTRQLCFHADDDPRLSLNCGMAFGGGTSYVRKGEQQYEASLKEKKQDQ